MRLPLLLVIAAAMLLGGCQRAKSHPIEVGSYPGRNILVISVDTLRADRLGAYGYARRTSPAIDALAAQALTFDLAFAPRGMTWPSLATMLTSLSPTTTNVRWNGQYLPRRVLTIAQLLQKAGYRAGAFLGGSICHMAQGIGTFDRLHCGDDAEITSKAIDFLVANNAQPFFGWLHLMAPHAPYNPPAEHDKFSAPDYHGPVGRDRFSLDGLVTSQQALTDADRKQLDALYDGEVLAADAQVSRVLKALDESTVRRDTIVVFTADHGEDLYEHNRYLYHACSIYDSSLRIPMILALPDGAGAGRRYPEVVELIDLAPTLLELVGVERPSFFEGKSMLARLAGQHTGEATASSEWYDPALRKSLQSVRTESWRYVSNPEGLTPNCVPAGNYYKVAKEELYDHRSDPREEVNVAADHPDLAKKFASLALSRRASAADDAPLPIDEKLEGELRSLGYLE